METNDRSVQFAGGILGRQRHVCAFFNSTDEEHRVLRSFIKDGFDQGDKAFHLVDPELREEHLRRLTEAGINVQEAMDTGQLEVRPWQEAYLRGDRFDQDAMLALIEEVLQSGAAGGYPLTRLLAHMEWALLDKPGVGDLLEYETRLNYVLPKYEDPVICTYDLARISSTLAMDIMRTHPAVIMGGLLHDNPFFVPPDQFLLEIRERGVDRPERKHGEPYVHRAQC
jgi:MEDS: MEthanogen/methylotroph, DcmR Sensory domain